MIRSALNPLAVAAVILSLVAHAVVVSTLLIKPVKKPAEHAQLVTIIATPVGAAEQRSAPPPVNVPPVKPPNTKMAAAAISNTTGPETTAQALPRGKPNSEPANPYSIAFFEPLGTAHPDTAATPSRIDQSTTIIETRVAVLPGNNQPHYPLVARKRGYEGKAIIRVELSSAGKVATAKIAESSGYTVLDTAAQEALSNWQFQPATRNGAPVAGRIDVPIEFRLR
ncbi:MAG: hypothetical protein CL573_05400 [Alphaproteobacteria bacterium]|nr:hypothetical protein [Alphaproteobacteria bacterium]HCP01472.1 hypothetical protein [Rhodospirillaceae bacterium]